MTPKSAGVNLEQVKAEIALFEVKLELHQRLLQASDQKDLAERMFVTSVWMLLRRSCGLSEDRDVKSAKTIALFGLGKIKSCCNNKNVPKGTILAVRKELKTLLDLTTSLILQILSIPD